MKVCLYFEGVEHLLKSGVGKALSHQKKALELAGVEYTTDPRDEYDILHINTLFIKSAGVIRRARKKGAKVVYHAHTTVEDYKYSFIFAQLTAPFVKWWIKRLYSMADVIVTPTPFSKSLLQGYGITRPIYAVSNGIDTDKFIKSEEKAVAFRSYFGLAPEQKAVISVGLWFRRKGILDFVEVASQMPDVTFIWFGCTPLLSIPAKVRRVIKKHPANVVFPGYMSGDVFEGAFTGADAFFFPSYAETEGIVTLEAIASEQTVIVRDIPVYDGWMEDGYNCRKGTDNPSFIRLLRDALEAGEEEQTLRQCARKTARERSLPHIGARLREIYENLLNEKSA